MRLGPGEGINTVHKVGSAVRGLPFVHGIRKFPGRCTDPWPCILRRSCLSAYSCPCLTVVAVCCLSAYSFSCLPLVLVYQLFVYLLSLFYRCASLLFVVYCLFACLRSCFTVVIFCCSLFVSLFV